MDLVKWFVKHVGCLVTSHVSMYKVYQHRLHSICLIITGCGTPCLLGNLGVQEVVGSGPGRGNSKECFLIQAGNW